MAMLVLKFSDREANLLSCTNTGLLKFHTVEDSLLCCDLMGGSYQVLMSNLDSHLIDTAHHTAECDRLSSSTAGSAEEEKARVRGGRCHC